MDMSEVSKLEQQQRITRLSEAIRIGAKIRPQCVGNLFHNGRSCALGAAYEGATGEMCEAWSYMAVQEQFPVLGSRGKLSPLGDLIINWNDCADMTREQIADKLAEMGL